MSETNKFIEIKNARVNNLKGIDIKIPRNKFIVITGVSGSGKSSLAFDTLYAEGQRRYVESLNSYARQFLGRNNKPEVDYIKGIPPAIAIEQKVNTRNPRSTVGTSTEVYDYLKLLFSRVGRTFSPISGTEVKRHTVGDVVSFFAQLPEGTKVALLAAVSVPPDRTMADHLAMLLKQGFSRIALGDSFVRLDADTIATIDAKAVSLVIDRLSATSDTATLNRLADSVQTAFFEGSGTCTLRVFAPDGSSTDHDFSNRFEADGMAFEEPSEQLFTFNSPLGACPRCEGFGRIIGIDEDLVIPNKTLSVYDDCVACWRGEKMSEWKQHLIRVAHKFDFPVTTPYCELTQQQRDALWHGNKYFEGIDAFFRYVEEQQYKIQYRVMLARYRGKTICPVCHGTRLRPEAGYVKVCGCSITDLVSMSIDNLCRWIDDARLDDYETKVAGRLFTEIRTRIHFLRDVGLDYLTLNRLSSTLSGGESQRINIATSLGSSLVGSLYILDEPSIGLHSRDTRLLIDVLRKLKAIGNTVVVVEHDEDIIRAADEIIDIGPEAGRHGGDVVFQGDFKALTTANSLTTKYLTGQMSIAVPKSRRRWNNFVELKGVCENNLKNVDVRFPLNVMTVVTGVSGSGKSTLVTRVLYPALSKHLGLGSTEATGSFASLGGSFSTISDVEFVDQNPIGKSTRSNPATYMKAYDDIRTLLCNQQLAKQNGYTKTTFSFNAEGGRCEQCQGEGVMKIEMQFMADIVLECDCCHGRRFKDEVLEVRYRGANVYDILEMTVNQAIEFFSQADGAVEKRIVQRLKSLQDVGLGYIKLGQSSSTLSGGESQRVKLASFLATEVAQPILFIFDEPTTGLHFHDISKLLSAFNALVERGHSLIIIEHNMDIIKNADWVIDLGPEGGEKGGGIVVAGTPETVADCPESYTGQYLKTYINPKTNSL